MPLKSKKNCLVIYEEIGKEGKFYVAGNLGLLLEDEVDQAMERTFNGDKCNYYVVKIIKKAFRPPPVIQKMVIEEVDPNIEYEGEIIEYS